MVFANTHSVNALANDAQQCLQHLLVAPPCVQRPLLPTRPCCHSSTHDCQDQALSPSHAVFVTLQWEVFKLRTS
jgi:hypothetical protein